MQSNRVFILKALAPLVIVLALGVYFQQEVVDSILFTPHPAIVLVIFGLTALGVLLLLINLRHLLQDQHLFNRLIPLDASLRHELLHTIRQQPGRFRALAGLLCMHPAPDRHEHKQACDAEIARIQYSYNEALAFPTFLSGSLVGLGLVGTFIGLLGALGDIADLISGLSVLNSQSGNMLELFAQLVKQLQNPMKSMATAFVASLFGLLGSMTLGFMLVAQRRFSPRLLNEWRSLVSESVLQANQQDDHAIPLGATPAENLKIAITEAEQWKQMFAQLRAEHKQLIESDQQLQQQSVHMIWQVQEQHQELIKRMEARQQELQQHTQQQVLLIQSETRELARVLHERNETDALVRRALGEGEHWMQTLMQLQETALQFVATQQEQSATEVAATQTSTDAMLRLLDRLQRADERQQHEVQQLAHEVRQLVGQIERFESTARQMSGAVLHNIESHQQALHDSIAKLRALLAFEIGELGLSAGKTTGGAASS